MSSVSRSLRGKREGSDSGSPAGEGGRSNGLEKAAKAPFKRDLSLKPVMGLEHGLESFLQLPDLGLLSWEVAVWGVKPSAWGLVIKLGGNLSFLFSGYR